MMRSGDEQIRWKTRSNGRRGRTTSNLESIDCRRKGKLLYTRRVRIYRSPGVALFGFNGVETCR